MVLFLPNSKISQDGVKAVSSFSFRKIEFSVLLLWENVVISQLMAYTILDVMIFFGYNGDEPLCNHMSGFDYTCLQTQVIMLHCLVAYFMDVLLPHFKQ